MDGYALTASLVGSFASMAWPIAAFACFFFLRKEVAALMPKLRIRVGENEVSFLSDAIQKAQAETVELMLEESKPGPLENLSKLTNDELKERVMDFSKRIREWDLQKQRERDQLMRRRHDDGKSWQEFSDRLISDSTEQNHEWRYNYQPTGLALRAELLSRVGNDHGIDMGEGDVALLHGMLAGVNPVSDAANLLELLSRKLQ